MTKTLLFILLFHFTFLASAQSPPKRELRGAWIATYLNIDWPSRTQTPAQQQAALITILDHHAATGMNAVYLQMRSQCDAMYPSSIEPWSADLNGVQGRAPTPLWDPLEFAIAETHKRGIEFHTWLNPYRAVGNISNLPNFANTHVAKVHPEWTLTIGTVQILNPALSAVRDYITSVVVDIVQRYDVDGIHFDDYFYPQGTIADTSYFTNDPRGFTNIADWRRDNVNLLIKKVYDTIRALKPWVKFGVAPTGIYRNSTDPAIGTPTSGLQHYTTLYCDSRKWIQQGWVDYLAPEVYWYIGQPGADYSKIVPWWSDNANSRHIYIGMAGYKVNDATQGAPWTNPSMIPNEVRLNRSYPNIFGEIIYNTSSLRSTTKLGFRDSLRLFFYQRPALLPAMPWRDNIAPASASALGATKYGNDSVVLHWTKPPFTANELDKAKRFVVYRSTNPVIDISNANNIVAITHGDTSAFADKTIAANTSYYYTITALDHFHNESVTSNTAADVPPAITCPETQTLNMTADCSVILPDYRNMATITNATTITQSPTPGSMINGRGNHTVTLTATNIVGQTASCSFTVTANDVTAPLITGISADPTTLFAPNHQMKTVTVAYSAADNCGGIASSLSVSSNEPSGNQPDWEVVDNHHVKLRAERNGYGSGRIYTIAITATDADGNSRTMPVLVTVPHDNGQTTTTARASEENIVTTETLLVTVSPNPSYNQFLINTRSNLQELISIRIMDNLGRMIESRVSIAPSSTIQLGSKYKAGIYYVEVRQGDKQQCLKLIKQ
ncbi:MAG TPA: family 10 glycosylhydrolase [Chitinophagaceae bacterium]|jgi:uncharacterized lipoprotein YddW (UPF0748 family)|nr:family 10 glycosylhydrolase [Chitinophagaceae bacterium]